MAEVSIATQKSTNSGENLHVLVVEDNAATAATMALFLRLNGHRVEIARNGREAMQVVDVTKPDVILLDLGLPTIEEGLEVAKQVRSRKGEKKPLLVAITGFAEQEDQKRSVEAGVDLHIVKPVDPPQLLDFFKRFHQAKN